MNLRRLFFLLAALLLAAGHSAAQSPAPPAAGTVFRDCPSCPEMVDLPAGGFTMGSSAEEKSWASTHGGRQDAVADEAPQHRVSLPSFALGKYDVTRGEYAEFARETGHPVGQWNPQRSNTAASLHGLSVVNANVVWAGGTAGTFLRTTDGGRTWQAGTVPGGEKLDFRDVYAVDAETAYLMSIGNGIESRIYKTTDAGKTWSLQYTEQNPKAFLDCMAFWNPARGIVVGDPLDGKSELLTTSDGGAHWTQLRPESLPTAKAGEGSPASGTCIATYSEKKGTEKTWHAWFVTENASRVFHSADAGKTWTASDTPLVTGLNQGVFSIAVVDANRLAIVGGDYDHPQLVKPNSAYSSDSGRMWKESTRRPAGYRWCVAIIPGTPGPTAFAVGPTGMDYSLDGGKNWEHLNEVSANTIAFADARHGWAVGEKGQILKFEGPSPAGAAPSADDGCGAGRAIFQWQKDPKVTWENPGYPQTERDPVVCVSWQDAKAYVAWLNKKTGLAGAYRLPSESEWEYAARAGATGKFWWGDDANGAPSHAWFRDNSDVTGCEGILGLFCTGGHTHPVGTKPPNAFGLYDMSGNVWQWTEDCYDNSYAPAPVDGRANDVPSSDPQANDGHGNCLRVDRGSSWMFPAWLLRPATRERNPADFRNVILGFRVARSLP